MNSKYSLITSTPTISHLFNDASGGTDILFDWQTLEIPVGTCILKSVTGTVAGHDGAANNGGDLTVYFARSINGVAPATFGTAHDPTSATISAAFRRNLIGMMYLDMTEFDDGDKLVGYSVLGTKTSTASTPNIQVGGLNSFPILQGDPAGTTSRGYQTVYYAAVAAGVAMNFGTAVALNMAGHQAASTAAVQITTSGTDPRICFQPGDLLQGSTGTVTAEVVSVDSATTMTVKDVSAQIDHTEVLILQNPIQLHFGLEY
jgi:hypothetical protein